MRTLFRASILAGIATAALAGPAAADAVTVNGCTTVTGAAGSLTACAFDSATVYYDDEPIRRSFLSCLYGTPIDWDGVDVFVTDFGPEVTYDLVAVGDGTVIDWNLGGPTYSTGYFEGGPDLNGGCV